MKLILDRHYLVVNKYSTFDLKCDQLPIYVDKNTRHNWQFACQLEDYRITDTVCHADWQATCTLCGRVACSRMAVGIKSYITQREETTLILRASDSIAMPRCQCCIINSPDFNVTSRHWLGLGAAISSVNHNILTINRTSLQPHATRVPACLTAVSAGYISYLNSFSPTHNF